MFWKREDAEPLSGGREDHVPRPGPLAEQEEEIEVERDLPRPAAVLKVAYALERKGIEVVELFKEVSSPRGRVVVSIHLREEGEDGFAEVFSGPWRPEDVREAIRTASVLRSSEYAGARLELFSAYPVPEEVATLFGTSPIALLQLDLLDEDPAARPEALAETFKEVAGRHWGVDLDYTLPSLLLTEELLSAALTDTADEVSVLEILPATLGCYLGEVIRHGATHRCAWDSHDRTLHLADGRVRPLQTARAFLDSKPGCSLYRFAADLLVQRPEQRYP